MLKKILTPNFVAGRRHGSSWWKENAHWCHHDGYCDGSWRLWDVLPFCKSVVNSVILWNRDNLGSVELTSKNWANVKIGSMRLRKVPRVDWTRKTECYRLSRYTLARRRGEGLVSRAPCALRCNSALVTGYISGWGISEYSLKPCSSIERWFELLIVLEHSYYEYEFRNICLRALLGSDWYARATEVLPSIAPRLRRLKSRSKHKNKTSQAFPMRYLQARFCTSLSPWPAYQ